MDTSKLFFFPFLEFQVRGLPHLHGVFWLNQTEAKKYQDGKGNFVDEKVPELIDKWISCSLTNYKKDPNNSKKLVSDEKLNKLVKEVNVHKHTKSCKKGTNSCRFSFPRLPSNKTLISNPVSEEDFRDVAHNLISNTISEEESSKQIYNLIHNPVSKEDLCKPMYKEKLDEAKSILQTVKDKLSDMSEKKLEKAITNFAKELYKKKISNAKTILSTVKNKLKEMTEADPEKPSSDDEKLDLENSSLDEILNHLKISSDDYHNALTISERGKTVVLKRKPNEMWVNNYNPHFMKAWTANMDIQANQI